MTQTKHTIESRKGKHLNFGERKQIEVLCQEDYSNRRIAEILGRSPQCINDEVNRGKVTQVRRQKQPKKTYTYYEERYSAEAGQAAYDKNRLNSGRRPKWTNGDTFLDWADKKMLNDKWSPDAVTGYAKANDLFDSTLVPCTTTLYHWIDKGIMKTTNMDLLEKLSRKPRKTTQDVRPNKRILGKSIEERPKSVDSRQTFGHWEIDTVIGNKTKDEPVLLTLVERHTRFEVLLKVAGKDQASVDQALSNLKERAGHRFPQLFKTVTSDNGSEFAGLHEALKESTEVYFSHPYASWERGTSENQHKFIRRFLPKGQSIHQIDERQCLRIQQWMNAYPRKILNYQTPHESFVKALKTA